MRKFPRLLLVPILLGAGSLGMAGQRYEPLPSGSTEVVEHVIGPYNVHALAGGTELRRPVPRESSVLEPGGAFTLELWVEMTAYMPTTTLIGGLGHVLDQDSVYLGLRAGRPALRTGEGQILLAPTALPSTGWHLLSVTSDGTITTLYVDGKPAGRTGPTASELAPILVAAPLVTESPSAGLISPAGQALGAEGWQHFGGRLAGFQLVPQLQSAEALLDASTHLPETRLLRFDEASPAWPLQTHGQAGYTEQQDPYLLPHSRAPLGKPVVDPMPLIADSALVMQGSDTWQLGANWKLQPAPQVTASPEELSTTGFNSTSWLQATVPGTVLTTMIQRGVYPDPDFGLNNMAIPESLARQDYWYRVEFPTPANVHDKTMTLTFNGINYAAEVWLNGKQLGDIRGAFIRGSFDVSALLKNSGQNALAVRIAPPPHPGIPQEQSLRGGPGENGGAMVIDGPTFMATEGWDWIPAMRDRNTGIWQDVVLHATEAIKLGDPQVITRLPLPDTSSADISINVPVRNTGNAPAAVAIRVQFEGVDITKTVPIAPGETQVQFKSADLLQLHVRNPRLWWPNGYGRPELYHLRLSVAVNGKPSDDQVTTFGIREVSYELSLFDSKGQLRRVEISPAEASRLRQHVVDVTHEGMRKREAEFASASLTSAGEHSPAVTAVSDEPGLTDLVIKVNGVRIAARGGNWGMDDSRKRVSREHLEPFFRLHREANVNIIRNWVGQDTEETFYQLADEYGLMVWNDFWESTQDYNLEAQDVPLFLDNARDVVRRFRNHPSIVMWCGRNEGVPQPVLNQGLIDLLSAEDGTRYYTPGSNRINLRNSGPYKYQNPKLYYTELDRGFSVELGISSLSTRESFEASIAPEDRWPISDAWAYHDWHWSGNGDVHPFLAAMEEQFGAATSFADFERKAQMINYVDHRAIFEGFNQHLWQPNSGRMLWMTQPAWPSNSWAIMSSDYDTNGSFYGVKKACEPLHVQLDLSNFAVAGVNTTRAGVDRVDVHARVVTLSNRVLLEQDGSANLGANATTPLFSLPLDPIFAREGVVLVELQMKDAVGKLLSQNTYWLAGTDAQYRKLNALPSVQLKAQAATHTDGADTLIELTLTNDSNAPALAVKTTLKQSKSRERILPAYYSDNYLTLLPGESTTVNIRYPTPLKLSEPLVEIRGWNVTADSVRVR